MACALTDPDVQRHVGLAEAPPLYRQPRISSADQGNLPEWIASRLASVGPLDTIPFP